MVCIYSYATTSNYAIVVSRAIQHVWENHRPKKGITRFSATLPVPVYVRVWGELKSTRCHKNKSYYTINIKPGNGPAIRVDCDEETLRIQFWDAPLMMWRAHAINIVNCFEDPEAVWDCMKGVLQVLPIDILTTDSETWTAPVAQQMKLARLAARITSSTPTQTNIFRRASRRRWTGIKAEFLVFRDAATKMSIDCVSPPPMPAWWTAIDMSAERMEPMPIVPDEKTLILDIKRLIRSYVFGTPEQMTKTAAIVHNGGAWPFAMHKALSIQRNHESPDLAVIDVDWRTGGILAIRRPAMSEANRIVATKKITIMSDPTSNRLPVEYSVRTLRKEIIRAKDVIDFVLQMERENRPRTIGLGVFGQEADHCHKFMECIHRVGIESRTGRMLTTQGVITEVWMVGWGS